jgi:hypothetical protein
MNWQLVHSDVAATNDSGIVSRSHIILEREGVQFELGKLETPEVHVLGAKRVLVDTANMLKRLAHEMENKADRLR